MGFLTKRRGKKRKFKPPQQLQQHSSSTNDSRMKLNPYEPLLKKQKRESLNTDSTNKKESKARRSSFKTPHRISDASPIDFAKKKEEETLDLLGAPRAWAVFHTKRSNKKHKNYVDGILRHDGKKVLLFDVDSGRKITSALWRKEFQQRIDKEEPLYFGTFQIEIDRVIDNKEFESGQCFNSTSSTTSATHHSHPIKRFKPLKVDAINSNSSKQKHKSFKIPSKIDRNGAKMDISKQYSHRKSMKPITDPSKIKNPLILNTKRLNPDYSAMDRKGADLRAVCVASFLSAKLRSHQREGIQYMYECVMGIKNGAHECGVILADEMGLGKTLQTIALIYTLLNDGAIKRYAIKKCLIVCPSSLVGNWRKEFMKWISMQRRGNCGVIAMDEKLKRKREHIIDTFIQKNSLKNVLIIGYEMLRSNIDILCKMKLGLIVCDEGHRLKNSRGNQTIDALNRLNVQKRILLTGTPIQNNLSELYAMCNYVNPMCLKDLNHFKYTYARPIEKSRDANASNNEKRIGDERSKALHEITNSFILRRTSEAILRKFLKPKDEYIVFHALNPLQKALYLCITNNKTVKSMVSQHNVRKALQCITYMRMCCSSARLAFNRISSSKTLNLRVPNEIRQQIIHNLDSGYSVSEKMKILMSLLKVTLDAKDKIVIVSNFTSILDEVQHMLQAQAQHYSYLRLDGSCSAQQRTKLVAQFNSRNNKEHFIFLLSAKAGGVGLNLIGANRLVLLDPDWNPAVDQQAMARIWRDGQKKKCKIYRFITIGSIEEKILQRQIMKNEVADSVVDRNGSARHKHKDRHFTKDELKEIFTLKSDVEKCETMDIMRENMKDWKMCYNKALIQAIIPTDHKRQIRVIFQRSVDPKIDPISKWKVEQTKLVNQEEDDDDDDDVYHDSDMDLEDEYIVERIYSDQEEEHEESDDDSDVLVLNKTEENKKKTRFVEEEDSDNDDSHNNRDILCSGANNTNGSDKEEEIQKQIENVIQNTQGSMTDLDISFEFD